MKRATSNDRLQRLEDRYQDACALLGVPPKKLPTEPTQSGWPHVEVEEGRYHVVTTDRGFETGHRVTQSEEEALFWLVSSVAFDAACAFELQHRVPHQDSRRLMFSKRVELLGRVSADFARREEERIQAILAIAPYIDNGQ